jgi:hypothetical protein
MEHLLLAQIINPVIEIPNVGSGNQGNLAIAILMARLFRTVLVVGGIALLLYLAWGGMSWITAGADKGKLEEAKTRIENALIGMAVLAGTIAIALFLQWTFGFDLLNPTLPTTP